MRTILLLGAAVTAWGQEGRALASITERQARATIASMRSQGQVGGSFGLRVTNTDRSSNYKLRATWIAADVAAAAASRLMSTKGYSETQAQVVAQSAVTAKGWLVLVELDPREGSGVTPKDWLAPIGKWHTERNVQHRILLAFCKRS